jgi:hypothetical protein
MICVMVDSVPISSMNCFWFVNDHIQKMFPRIYNLHQISNLYGSILLGFQEQLLHVNNQTVQGSLALSVELHESRWLEWHARGGPCSDYYKTRICCSEGLGCRHDHCLLMLSWQGFYLIADMIILY